MKTEWIVERLSCDGVVEDWLFIWAEDEGAALVFVADLWSNREWDYCAVRSSFNPFAALALRNACPT